MAEVTVVILRGHQGHGIVRTILSDGEWMDTGAELTQEEKRRLSPNADWEARHY